MGVPEKGDLILLLKEIDKAGVPLGASTLCSRVMSSQATVGRQLVCLEKKGLVKRIGNKGRVLTPEGVNFLKLEDAHQSSGELAQDIVAASVNRSPAVLLEIIRIRELLEPYAAAGAAERANESDLYHLENLAFAHRYSLTQGRPGNEENLNFHLKIARINGNRTLLKTLGLLLTANEAYVEFSRAGETEPDRQVNDHIQILKAIQEKNGEGARRAMYEHLEDVARDIERSQR